MLNGAPSPPTYTRARNSIDCVFRSRHIDSIMYCNVPANMLPSEGLESLRLRATATDSLTVIELSYVGRLSKPRQEVKTSEEARLTGSISRPNKQWTWCLSGRGYLTCCSPQSIEGDLICPLTGDHCILVRVENGHGRIVGQAYRLNLMYYKAAIQVAPLGYRPSYEEKQRHGLRLSANSSPTGLARDARGPHLVMARRSMARKPVSTGIDSLTLHLETSEVLSLARSNSFVRARIDFESKVYGKLLKRDRWPAVLVPPQHPLPPHVQSGLKLGVFNVRSRRMDFKIQLLRYNPIRFHHDSLHERVSAVLTMCTAGS